MRRGVGVAAFKTDENSKKNFQSIGRALEESQMEHLTKALNVFKENLQLFAVKHKNEIRSNPVFRAQFASMCREAGVDPLASNRGFWAQLLNVSDFYYELAVQCVDVCLQTRPQNGGLVSPTELTTRVTALRGKYAQAISMDDVLQAVKKLSILGSGYSVISLGAKKDEKLMILTVPVELNKDHMLLLAEAEKQGPTTPRVSFAHVERTLGWDRVRFDRTVKSLMDDGMVWVYDPPPTGDREYWFPSLLTTYLSAAAASASPSSPATPVRSPSSSKGR